MFTRLKGKTGRWHEYRALISPGSEYCVVPLADAFAMGYSEAALRDPLVSQSLFSTASSFTGLLKAPKVRMDEVAIGPLSSSDVEFLVYDIPRQNAVDVVLGWSLLKQFRIEIDNPSRRITLNKKEQVQT